MSELAPASNKDAAYSSCFLYSSCHFKYTDKSLLFSGEPASLRNPLAGPASVSLPAAARQVQPVQKTTRPITHARTTDEMGLKQRSAPKYSSSIMKSSPDVVLHKEKDDVKSQPAHQVGSQQMASSLALQNGLPDSLTHPEAGGQGEVGLGSESPSVISGLSPQPSAPESSISLSIMNGSEAPSTNGFAVDRHLPKQTSTAEEVMRDYLVGEGIKKAHFRALHPKAPKKKKTGFFASLFDRSSKA